MFSHKSFKIKIKYFKTNNEKDRIYKSDVVEVVSKVDKLFNKLNTRVQLTDVELLQNEVFEFTGNSDQVRLTYKLVCF